MLPGATLGLHLSSVTKLTTSPSSVRSSPDEPRFMHFVTESAMPEDGVPSRTTQSFGKKKFEIAPASARRGRIKMATAERAVVNFMVALICFCDRSTVLRVL